MPAPDTTPYTHSQTSLPKFEPVQPPRGVGARSLFISFTRSVSWTLLFSSLGVVAGTALITWEYIQPPFEPGSEMEEDLLDEINDAVELHPLVDSLTAGELG